ncbi:MAG: MinD/ParA family protein [Desulfuromonadaceae bacterium]|nr:MinD/ParA family protein [Desulfuromonas sp.]MDY0185008.1 MinD/ParA family protein [Desulfuromonadaceae bacterium]
MTNLASEHTDQARTLRSLSGQLSESPRMSAGANQAARVLSVTSGKGGVGKTSVVSNLAVVLGKMGKKVLIIDADLGLANIDVVFGLAPQYNLNHFFSGQRSLAEIMVEGPYGIQILPAGSGVQKFTRLDSGHKMRLLEDLETLPGDFDIVLIDTEAGISENVTYFNQAAQDILVVTSPEPTAITDAYALMKLLSSQFHEKSFSLIVNSVRHTDEALDVYRKLTMVSNRYLDISIDYLGGIPFERKMYEAVRSQKVMVELYPNNKVSLAFEQLGRKLVAENGHTQPKGSLQFFWKRLLSLGGNA